MKIIVESNDWRKEICDYLGIDKTTRIPWNKITRKQAKELQGKSHGMPKAIYDKLRQQELHGPKD
jgi:hypothetical protein